MAIVSAATLHWYVVNGISPETVMLIPVEKVVTISSVSTDIKVITYCRTMPFRSSGSGGSQKIKMDLESVTMAWESVGGPDGAVK